MTQVDEQETSDDIVEETRRIKAMLAESMNFDIDRILAAARQKQQQARRTILAQPIRQNL